MRARITWGLASVLRLLTRAAARRPASIRWHAGSCALMSDQFAVRRLVVLPLLHALGLASLLCLSTQAARLWIVDQGLRSLERARFRPGAFNRLLVA